MDLKQWIARAEGVIFTELDGDTVILDMESGEYNGLDEVGTAVWNFLQNEATFAQIVDHIVTGYEVDRKTCRDDLQSFITEMVTNGLFISRSDPKQG